MVPQDVGIPGLGNRPLSTGPGVALTGMATDADLVCWDPDLRYRVITARGDHGCHGYCPDFEWLHEGGRDDLHPIGQSILSGQRYVGEDGFDPERYCYRCAAHRFPFVGFRGTPDGDRLIADHSGRVGEWLRRATVEGEGQTSA